MQEPRGSDAKPDAIKAGVFRVQPQNEEAEQALLGALLVNNHSIDKINDFLKQEHFFSPVHGRIYAAILAFEARGQVANPVTLKSYFDNDSDLSTVGGAGYLAELAACVITVVNVADYAHTIHNHFLRRQLIAIGEDMVNAAYQHDIDVTPQQQIEHIEKSMFDLASKGDSRGGLLPFTRALTSAISTAEDAFKRESHITGVTTGLIDLDRKLGGLHRSDLIILAGRPSMGKTALATNIAVNAAKAYRASKSIDGAAVAVFSLEMSAEQLAMRVIAEEVQISGDKIRRGEVRDIDFPRFIEANHLLSQIPLYVDDTPGITVSMLRSRARRLKRDSRGQGLGMIVIDYLQLMTGSGSRSSDNRNQEVSEITRGLKAVARELDVPVLALSQLSRGVENREDKRPQLSDLRDSGAIEQDADVVMFVYREEYYHERAEPSHKPDETNEKYNDRYQRWMSHAEEIHNVAECIAAKQRHGPIGTVKLHFNGELTKFSDLSEERH